MKLFRVTCLVVVVTCLTQLFYAWPLVKLSRADEDHGIKEVVPQQFRDRYDRWKAELLSTEFGRDQWSRYENNEKFLLKIVVTSNKKFGARTGDFRWDSDGQLIGATIMLGKNLGHGYPDPIYYPVMNSLSEITDPIDMNNILASTKFAHEFGHVAETSQVDGRLFQEQDKLISSYYDIFLNNGYNTQDARLVKLANELGRQPIEIWEDREYWGEVSAMRYLVGRIRNEFYFCSVVGRIMRNVNEYASNYEDRFGKVAETSAVGCRY